MRRLILSRFHRVVGTQALDIVRANPDLFTVVGLAAGGGNPELFARQQAEFPAAAATALGAAAATRLVEDTDADLVLNGITGSVGLGSTLATLDKGVTLALANKESLVAGGALVTGAAKPGQIVPVDSEHSALAQCLRPGTGGGRQAGRHGVRRPVPRPHPDRVDARSHRSRRSPIRPGAMGPVVTINSATLVNKGLEVIEAHLLFDIPYDRIDTVAHPQSIVHSMVTFTDGSTIAQASPPDMKLPIALALNWPQRVPAPRSPCDFAQAQQWTFEPIDHDTFPAIRLAGRRGSAVG